MVLILITALPIGLILDNTIQDTLLKSYINTSNEQLKTINEATKIFQGAIDKDIKMFATDSLILKANDTITKYMENTDAKKVMTPSKNGGIEQEIYTAFDHYAKTHPGTLYVYMGTENGGYIQWPETANSPKYDPRIRPWYTAAIKNGDKISRTDPYTDSTTGAMIVSNSIPIKTSDGKIIGVMAIDASSQTITEILKGIKIGETGYCMMIHKSGLILADPSNPKNNNKYLKDIGIPGFEKVLGSGQEQLEVTINNEKYFATSLQPKDSDWVIISLITTSELYKNATKIRGIIFFVCLVTLVIGFFLTFIGSRKIVKPIVAISNVAQNVADGNLLLNVQQGGSKDEIGILENSIARMLGNLRQMIGNTAQAAEQLSASSEELTASAAHSAQAADQVAGSILQMVQGTESQRRATNNTLGIVEHMSVNLKEIGIHIDEVAEQSNQVVDRARNSNNLVDKAASQMDKIEQTVNTSAQVVTKLGDRSKEIGQIVDTISGIAGQTNLLALNAAIEAARAGEQGRGFAVVAEEVRKLAEQSQIATKQITQLINEIQVDTDQAVVAMSDGTREVKLGAQLVNDSGTAFQEIARMVKQVSDKITEVALASNRLSSGSQQIIISVQQIEEACKVSSEEAETIAAASQEQSASMEEIASASQSLTMLAQELQETVNEFKL